MTYSRWRFPHEDLLVYQDARDFLRSVTALTWPRGQQDLRRQLTRAAVSILLNVCEGRAQKFAGNTGCNFYRIALGSAAECHGALEALEIVSAVNLSREITQVRQIGARLTGLQRACSPPAKTGC